jgi:hypothetical protein
VKRSWVLAVVGLALGYAVVRWPQALSLMLGLMALFFVPRWLLLAGAVVADWSFGRPISAVGLLISDLLLAVFLARWTIPRLIRGDFALTPQIRRLAAWTIGFVLWTWISLAVADSWSTAPALGRVTMYLLVLLAAADYPNRGLPQMVALYASVEAALALSGVTGGSVGDRLVGLGGDPEILATLMIAGIACSVTFRRLRLPMLALMVAAGALTLTRTAWVAGAVMLALILMPRLTRRRTTLVGLAGVAVLLAFWLHPLVTATLQLNPQSFELRRASWEAGTNVALEHPLVGVGWSLGEASNLWINLAASTGILGAVLFTGLLVSVFRRLAGHADPVVRAGLLYLVGFGIYSLQTMTVSAGNRMTIAFAALVGSGLGAISDPSPLSERRNKSRPRPLRAPERPSARSG